MNANQSLREFLSAYFHEDWALDAQSPSDVVVQFFRDQKSVADLIPIARALRELIDGNADDEALSTRLFREFGSYFDPRGVGESTRSWLAGLADEFDREIAKRG
jgi:hypothetical protein